MGSSNYTCAVSGLPIASGEKVRFGLLVQNPAYKPGSIVCRIDDAWAIRAVPLRAEYNDYCSITNEEDGVNKRLWMECLDEDLVVREQGENPYHDVPTPKGMSFGHFLSALGAGRILVRGSFKESDQLVVSQFMIREDVWQFLCQEHSLACGGGGFRLESVKARCWKEAQQIIDYRRAEAETPAGEAYAEFLRSHELIHWSDRIITDPLGVNGLGTALDCLIDDLVAGYVTVEEAKSWVDSAAEMVHVERVLVALRHKWDDRGCVYPQHGEWDHHKRFHEACARIADTRLAYYSGLE
jgi:hypothetical protein